MRPEGMLWKEFVVMRQTIQLRVINALKLWVELSVDFIGMLTQSLMWWITNDVIVVHLWISLDTFADSKNLQARVLMFVKTIASLDHPRQCKALRNNILTIKVRPQMLSLPPPPLPTMSLPPSLSPFSPPDVPVLRDPISCPNYFMYAPPTLFREWFRRSISKHSGTLPLPSR